MPAFEDQLREVSSTDITNAITAMNELTTANTGTIHSKKAEVGKFLVELLYAGKVGTLRLDAAAKAYNGLELESGRQFVDGRVSNSVRNLLRALCAQLGQIKQTQARAAAQVAAVVQPPAPLVAKIVSPVPGDVAAPMALPITQPGEAVCPGDDYIPGTVLPLQEGVDLIIARAAAGKWDMYIERQGNGVVLVKKSAEQMKKEAELFDQKPE